MKNICILGLGNIAHRVAKGVIFSKNATLYAVASRDIHKSEEFAKKYSANKYYGSYEELLSDENVDLVYICTPNQMHFDHIMLCLSYQKHVICEKPMVANEEQVAWLFAEARKKQLFFDGSRKNHVHTFKCQIKVYDPRWCHRKTQVH